MYKIKVQIFLHNVAQCVDEPQQMLIFTEKEQISGIHY